MSEAGGESEGLRVQMARIEGKLDLSNLRHEQTDLWKTTVDGRLHRQGNELLVVKAEVSSLLGLPPRVDALESVRERQIGERQGLTLSAGVIKWVMPGGTFAMLAAALFKLFGH